MKYKILAILTLIATSLNAQRVLSLEECRELAVNNNAAVKVAQGKAEQAELTRKEAFTKYFPEITATGMGLRANKPMFHYNVLDMFSIDLIRKGYAGGITALQPIFTGGRIANGNKLAKVGVEAGKLEIENAEDNVLLTAEQYYWQIVTLKSKKSTLAKAIEWVDSLTVQVGNAVNAGIINRNELLKAQLKLNSLRADMIDLDNGIDLSRRLLAQYVGLEGQEVDIDLANVPDDVVALPTDLYIDPSQALSATADYQLLDAQVRAKDLERSITIGENLPTIAVGGGIFHDNIFNQGHSFAAAMIAVQVPISGWWGGSHAIKRSKIAAANARTEMTNLSEMLKIKMADQWDNLTAAHRKMTIAHQSIAQAAENLRISRNYYDAGMSTMTDLLDAETLHRQALDNYTESYGAYRQAVAAYLNATGRSRSALAQ